jgi:hypothetical protein
MSCLNEKANQVKATGNLYIDENNAQRSVNVHVSERSDPYRTLNSCFVTVECENFTTAGFAKNCYFG